jgi:hypothetical protein
MASLLAGYVGALLDVQHRMDHALVGLAEQMEDGEHRDRLLEIIEDTCAQRLTIATAAERMAAD